MKRGFTLLEILIVIIIVAILATLGITQYMTTIERSRGAEIKQVFGHMRQMCAALYMEDGDTARCTDANLGLGAAPQTPPTATGCRTTHHFSYAVANNGAGTATFTATRCAAGGKSNSNNGNVPSLTVDYAAGGSDAWNNPFGY
jgi:prepilin-type N-terminal cleavage/methylation domain-containing protein